MTILWANGLIVATGYDFGYAHFLLEPDGDPGHLELRAYPPLTDQATLHLAPDLRMVAYGRAQEVPPGYSVLRLTRFTLEAHQIRRDHFDLTLLHDGLLARLYHAWRATRRRGPTAGDPGALFAAQEARTLLRGYARHTTCAGFTRFCHVTLLAEARGVAPADLPDPDPPLTDVQAAIAAQALREDRHVPAWALPPARYWG